MAIKFAKDIVKEMNQKERVRINEHRVSGESFERWWYKEAFLVDIYTSISIPVTQEYNQWNSLEERERVLYSGSLDDEDFVEAA